MEVPQSEDSGSDTEEDKEPEFGSINDRQLSDLQESNVRESRLRSGHINSLHMALQQHDQVDQVLQVHEAEVSAAQAHSETRKEFINMVNVLEKTQRLEAKFD